MSVLTWDGTANPVLREQMFRRERGQEKKHFPVQLTTSKIGNHTRLMLSLLNVLTMYTFYLKTPNSLSRLFGLVSQHWEYSYEYVVM